MARVSQVDDEDPQRVGSISGSNLEARLRQFTYTDLTNACCPVADEDKARRIRSRRVRPAVPR
jgi:hypothetical protein